ncbi:hypothetical protein CK203_043195 [Vitis vinifera]|uniref:Uncharacterized protein n=1 Tax=Vitis vinifera TaxID=29760 RepID=A0A438HPE2_VITVI|nr:hypothetical protein CK203_043195 [Vitis vinifera]
MEVNIWSSKIISLSTTFLTSPLHHIPLNTMATLKEDTAISLKLVSPYSLMLHLATTFWPHAFATAVYLFPYTSLHTTLPRPNSTTISTWIPPVLSVSTPTSSQQEAITPSAASSQGLPLFETTSPPTAPSPPQASSAPQPSPQSSLTTTEPQIPVHLHSIPHDYLRQE